MNKLHLEKGTNRRGFNWYIYIYIYINIDQDQYIDIYIDQDGH